MTTWWSLRSLADRMLPGSLPRFVFVGGLGTVTNTLTFYITVEVARISPTLGAVGAFALAVSQNYVLNQLWTFSISRSSGGLSWPRYGKFVATSIGALVVNLAVLHVLLHAATFSLKTVPELIGIACGGAINYLASRYLVFLRRMI